MIEAREAEAFLSLRRIAVVGASADAKSFGRTIYKELREHGHEVVAVNPNTTTVEGDRCYPTLAAVPGAVDGVVVMVGAARSADVVRACAERAIEHVWLFKGLGGAGSVSDEALEVGRENSMHVVAGACPLMFLEPVGWAHRTHRALRRLNGSVSQG